MAHKKKPANPDQLSFTFDDGESAQKSGEKRKKSTKVGKTDPVSARSRKIKIVKKGKTVKKLAKGERPVGKVVKGKESSGKSMESADKAERPAAEAEELAGEGETVAAEAELLAGETLVMPEEPLAAPIREDEIEIKAHAMASLQREISISEFFAKNRHLLGFDNPRKALLTTVKEAVDNSLDACEEAGILPEIEVGIRQTGEDRFLVWVTDNGPGIVKAQIPNIFGRLLYGSKFHTLRMARGQQGIGISAAGMYGLLTTGKNVKIVSRLGSKREAHHYELRIDTRRNRPEIIKDEVVEWAQSRGTRVEIELEARYQKGRQSVDEYLSQTAITNPHAELRYITPDGQLELYERTVTKVVAAPESVKPHPYGVEIGVLMRMSKETAAKTMAGFLTDEFSRVSPKVSQTLLDKAKISAHKKPGLLTHGEVQNLYEAIKGTKIMAPSTSCVVPIGEDALKKGLSQVVEADFYDVCTRPPSVYRGNPFQVEVALAYGKGHAKQADDEVDDEEVFAKNGKKNGNGDDNQLMRVLRFANRVPLLYQQSGCAVFKSILQTNWRLYGLSQSRGALPGGPVTVIVHIASVWVPFTSESKEAVAHYPEIIKEIKLALSECGRRLGRYLRGEKRRKEETLKRSYIQKYMPAIGEALRDILSLKQSQVDRLLINLEEVLERTRPKAAAPGKKLPVEVEAGSQTGS